LAKLILKKIPHSHAPTHSPIIASVAAADNKHLCFKDLDRRKRRRRRRRRRLSIYIALLPLCAQRNMCAVVAMNVFKDGEKIYQ
jgi:hypothetical protein